MIKKKILSALLILGTFLSLIPNAFALPVLDDSIYIDESFQWLMATRGFTGHEPMSDYEPMLRRRSDNQPVYCIQPHVQFVEGSVHGTVDKNTMSSISGLSIDVLEKVQLITYYGYGYGNHTSNDWYAATQMLIWETVKPGWTYPVDVKGSTVRSSKYDSYYAEINNLVANHVTTPSFNGSRVTLKSGGTTTVKDTNGVLSKYYNSYEDSHIKAEVQGNNLVITAKTAYSGQIRLNTKENTNPPILYDNSHQLTLSRGDPYGTSAFLNVYSSVKVEGTKVYGDNDAGIYRPEANAEFEIWNTDTNILVTTVKTDVDGKFTWELGCGTYRIHQIKGMKGYQFIDDYVFTITNNSTHEILYLKNEIGSGTFELTKKDFSTGKVLPNTLIEIYDNDNDELVFRGRTDIDGKLVVKGLKVGKYYFVEKDAPEGYVLNPNKMYFEIKKNNEIVKSTLTNEKIKSKIQVHKVDEKGKALEGVEFGIYNKNGNLISKHKTDKNGYIEVELEYGSYYLQEIATVEGYKISNEKVYFDVTKDGEIIQKTMINEIIKSKIKIHKVDEKGKDLEGVEFGIYDKKGNLISKHKTDKEGYIEVELEYGSYYLQEIATVEGYKISDEKVYFDVTKDGEIIQKKMINEIIKSKIKIHKVDEKGKSLEGVEFGIFDEKGNLISKHKTDKNGYIEVELEYGSYYLQEIATIDGYKISDEKVYFDVTKDGEIIQKTIINELEEISVPDTLSNSYISIISSIIVFAGASLVVVSKKKKKK